MNLLRQFLYFTKPQLRGVIALLFCILIVALTPKIYLFFFPPSFLSDPAFGSKVDAFQQELETQKTIQSNAESSPEFNPYEEARTSFQPREARVFKPFPFNPNTIGTEEWKLLGMSEKQAAAIERAKQKGFRFKNAEDLKRVYVIGEKGYERLKDYVHIPEEIPRTFSHKNPTAPSEKQQKPFVVNINTADTFELTKLKGIGAGYARRIYKYRMLLGGFHNMEQLKEVWGMPDSVIEQIKPFVKIDESDLLTISVNSDEEESIKKHPYIRCPKAKLLVAYRQQHGNFKSFETVQKALLMEDSAFTKLKPYLRLE